MAGYIVINRSLPDGAQLGSLLDEARDVLNRINARKSIMDAQVNGADYTLVESRLGLSAGQGQLVYNLVAGALVKINDPAVLSMLNDLQ